MNGEGGSFGERFGEAKVVVGEAGIGAVLVEGRNDADRSLVKHERDIERRHAADSAGDDLIDLRILQDRVDALALPARKDPSELRFGGDAIADQVGATLAVGGGNAKTAGRGGD